MQTAKQVHIKRFRVFDIESQTLVGKYDTLRECIDILKPSWELSKKLPSEGGNPYLDFMVDDVHDDIEVNWADLMGAIEEGECPADLQMF